MNFYQEHMWMTLDSCTSKLDDGTTYVITGDINGMWIRDSAAQLNPYISLAQTQEGSEVLRPVLEGAVKRQAQFILTDPYANAYTIDWNSQTDERLNRRALVFTGNYELDSGAYFFRFLRRLTEAFPDTNLLSDKTVHQAARMMVALYRQEQDHCRGASQYIYPRSEPWELPGEDGKGLPTKCTGMVWNAFRPSDDAGKFAYHIPGNLFLAAELKPLANLASQHWKDPDLAEAALDLHSSIVEGVRKYGTTEHKGEKVYCYEVDGLGNCNLMDDANVPSLLSIPYLDPQGDTFDKNTYQATRRFALSSDNPWYFEGSVGKGIGSPHTGQDMIWPLSLVMQALTEDDSSSKDSLLQTLTSGELGSKGLTESFHKDDHSRITRPWFGWPNSLLGELLMSDGKWSPSLDGLKAKEPKTKRALGPGGSSLYEVDAASLRREGVVLPDVERYMQKGLKWQSEDHSP